MPTATLPTGIDVHAAVKAALAFFQKTFGSTGLKNVQLEEIEKSKDGKFWLITVGYNDPNLNWMMPAGELFRSPPKRPAASDLRQYKVVSVNAKTGEVGSVKIRV